MLLATEPEEVAWAKKNADSDSDQLTPSLAMKYRIFQNRYL